MKNFLAAARMRVVLAGGFTIVVIACGSVGGNPGLNGDGGSTGSSSGTSAGSSISSGSSTTGSTSSSSGASSSGPPATCSSNVTACGGSVVGTWTATSSCLSVSGQIDMTPFGLGSVAQPCTSAPVTGSLQVTGTWTANSDGTYSDNTTTSGSEQIMLPAACLLISGTTTTCDDVSGPLQAAGYASITCAAAAGGGCACSGTVQQAGGLGVVSGSASAGGMFTSANNVITTSSPPGPQYSYCTSGSTLTVTPQSTSPILTGTVVLQGNGSSGSSSSSSSMAMGSSSSSGASSSSGSSCGTFECLTSSSSNGSGYSNASSSSKSSSSSGTTTAVMGPCDIYASGNTPCVAAYSTVRSLSSKYTGPLYQVRMGGSKTGTGGTTQDIGTIAGGFANGAAQDTFCGTSSCTISKLYDQSGKGNDLTVAPAGCYTGTASDPDNESNATAHSLTVSGHKAYALYMVPQDGYRNDKTSGMPTGTASQGIYEVADGTRIGGACCWDFGNAKTNNCNGATGSMDAMYFGTGYWGKGAGSGPWFMGDFEDGVWSGGSGASGTTNSKLPASNMPYAFGTLKTSTTNNTPQYEISVGNAQSGTLTVAYNGQAPAAWSTSGAIILGIGGDNSNSSLGTYFEGAITAGLPSDATDALVLQNVQAAGYGK